MSTSSIAEKIHTYLEPLALDSKFSGSILASVNGEMIYSNSFGKANLELDVNNTTKTLFRIGSITKTFTAVSILQLVQSGKLKLEDCIHNYFPNRRMESTYPFITY